MPARKQDRHARFWAKVDKNGPAPEARPELGPCWLWTSALDNGGYPLFWVGETMRAGKAHRLAYEELVGPIPAGLTLDHLCSVRRCVNPAHLDPCTMGENVRRSPNTPWARKARWTHCSRGHEFTPENTRIHHGRRRCRLCDNASARRRAA